MALLDPLKAVRWTTWLLLLVVLFFAIVRWRLRDIALERDEGEYAYSGQLILQGIAPYKLAYNMKLPGTYAAYALVMGLFGESSAGIHVGLMLMNAATALMIFLLGRKMFGTVAGSVAGMCYALASSSPAVMGLAGHATNFVVFAAVPGILLLLYAIEQDSSRLLFGAGTCMGLAFLMKQPGAIFAAFALFYFCYDKWQRMDWEYGFPRVGALLAGIVWPFALTCLILYWSGAFRTFWFWTFSYASTYAAEVPFFQGLMLLQAALHKILSFGGAVWILAAFGLIALFWQQRAIRHRIFVVGLLVFSGVGVAAGSYFRPHYFVLLLPVVSLLAGLAISSTAEVLDRWPASQPVARWVAAAVFAAVFAISLVQEGGIVFAAGPIVASNRLYSNNPFLAAREAGRYLESVSSPETRVAVLGSEPEIYFYSHRHSATGYVYTYSLMEDQQYAAQMAQEMIQEITRSQPEFAVFVDDSMSWLWRQGASQEMFFNWIQTYINGQYVKTAQVDIGGEAGHLLGNMPRIYVFRRKPR